jgi:hypothetical protein
MVMKVQSPVISYCEEFCSHIYEDKLRNSILLNVGTSWFETLYEGMRKRHYTLVHCTEMPSSITCVFLKT